MVKNLGKPQLAVVTGAAKRIGKAVALGLANQGFAIGLHYFTSEKAAEETAAEIEALNVPVIPLQANLQDDCQIHRMFEKVKGSGYPISVLVNSASVMSAGSVQELTIEDWDRTMNLNLRAPWYCSKIASQIMDRGGCIINISDAGAGHTWTKYPVYSISKSGLEVLTRILAKSLAPSIRVNCVAPGLIMSSPDMPEVDWEKLISRLPIKSEGSAQEVVKAVLFFLENSYITGQTLAVDGGYQLI